MLLAFALAMLLGQSELREKIVGDLCDGARAKGDPEALSELGEPGRRALLELAASSGIEAGCAFEHLASLDDRRVLPLLRSALADESALPPVRRQAVAFLGLLGDAASLDGILALCRPGDEGLLVSCLGALGAIDDERAREALRAAAADPAFTGVRPTVIRSIGRQADARAIPALDALATDAQALAEPVVGNQIRYELALALARIGTPESRARAVEVVGDIANPEKKRLTIRDVGRELRRQLDSADDDAERGEIDAALRSLAETYRALERR